MRILLLTPAAYGVNGGIALYNRDVIESLALMPEVSEIIVLPREAPKDLTVYVDKVTFVSSASGGAGSFVARLLMTLSKPFDLVICGHINLAPFAVMATRHYKTKLVMLVYGIDVWDRPRRSNELALRHFNAVWTISEITKSRMNNWAGLSADRYTVLPNAIHLTQYGLLPQSHELRDELGISNRKVLLTLSRLPGFDRYKGIDEVLEVLPDLIKVRSDLCYVVVGDGQDRKRLETKSTQLGLSDYVCFVGYVDESRKAAFYQMADLFVLPGRGEGFGFVFLEALACGLPVIGSRLDGSREALRAGLLGELVDPRNLAEVKDAILRTLSKPKEIPEGLSYFDWPMFNERLHIATRAVMSSPA